MNVKAGKMIWFHLFTLVVNPIPMIVEYLLVTEHPPGIENENERRILDFLNKVDHQLIAECRWKSHVPGNDEALTNPLVHEIKCSQRK